MAFDPTEDAAFNAGLADAVDRVLKAHAELDRRAEYPWMHACLGDPSAPVWFLAENPSVTQMRRVTELDAERQWAVSQSDKLFREALYRNGFKTGTSSLAPGGWHCYISDVVKAPVIVSEWHGRHQRERDELADRWAPVLRYEITHGSPRLIVLMGDNARRHFNRWRLAGDIPLAPPAVQVWHYAFRPHTPERVDLYHRQFEAVATLAAELLPC